MINSKDAVMPATAESILDSFADILSKSDASREELIAAVDDWWFIPRLTQGLELYEKRFPETMKLYNETGMLPGYFREAFDFATSKRWQEVKEFVNEVETRKVLEAAA